jgi:hypothetical protein
MFTALPDRRRRQTERQLLRIIAQFSRFVQGINRRGVRKMAAIPQSV